MTKNKKRQQLTINNKDVGYGIQYSDDVIVSKRQSPGKVQATPCPLEVVNRDQHLSPSGTVVQ